MLGRSIYESTKRDIQDHANTFTAQLREQLAEETSLYRAVQSANSTAIRYHQQLTNTVFNRLREVGNNAIDYYAPELDALGKEQAVGLAMDELVHSKYYGLTLPQRLRQSHLQLRSNIKRSSVVGVKLETRLENVTRVFNYTYPFGAQKSWDTRLFLAEAVRIEHVIAKNIAIRKSLKLMRWTLSAVHPEPDICDRYANAVDPAVDAFIQKNKFDIDTHGVYFLENVPKIPHPNCQCVIRYVNESRRGRRRKPKKKLNLVQRIIKAIFG